MRSIPKALIYLRLVLGLAIFAISIFHIRCSGVIPVTLFSLGLLSDIFDGIIARRLNVSTEHLRRLDSTIDQVFWLLVAASVFISHPDFFYTHIIKVMALILTEAITYVVCFVRFRKEVATHAIGSKIWTLVLFVTLAQIMYTGESGIFFDICFYAGIVTRLEVMAILLALRTWTNDVPSFYHALLLRQGKPIKRHKLFNG